MKNIYITLSLFFALSSMFAQTYKGIPYTEDFEGTLGSEWTTVQPVSTNAAISSVDPHEGANHLLLDNGVAGAAATKEAVLHLNLSAASEYTMEFYLKDFGDEINPEDGLFVYDTSISSYRKIMDLYGASAYTLYTLDLDFILDTMGILLSDSIQIKFQENDNSAYNGGNPDGFAIDLITVFLTPSLTAGSILGTDTVCFDSIATGMVTLTETASSLYGEGNKYYQWQKTSNLLVWDSITTSTSTDTFFTAPSVTTLYRRCALTASEGLSCSTPILISVAPQTTTQIFGLQSSYSNTDGSQNIFGSPIVGIFTGTGITDNADGSASLDVSSGGLGNRTITYTYVDSYGCTTSKDSVTNIILGSSVIYKPIPYTQDFEAVIGWTGATEWRRENTNPRVEINGDATPYEGVGALILDDNNTGDMTSYTRSAILHLDLSASSDYTMEFFWKDFTDGNDAEDGIFMYKKSTTSWENIHPLLPASNIDFQWTKVVLDLDALALANGIALNDSIQIKFQQKGSRKYNEAIKDGIAFDSIAVYSSLPLQAGSVLGSDTICYAVASASGASISILNKNSAQFGNGIYSYEWESSVDLLTWSSEGFSSTSDTILTTPTASRYFRRCVSTSSEGPECTQSVFIRVEQEPIVFLNVTDTSLCNNEDPILISGVPGNSNGSFTTFTGLIDNGNGTASLNPSTTGLGIKSIYYTYTNYFGCTAKDSVKFLINGAPTASFSGLAATASTNDGPQVLTGVPTGGIFSGIAISGSAFYPSIAPADTAIKILYTYTDGFGCTDTSSPQTIVVDTGATGAITGALLSSYCSDFSNVVELKGEAPAGWTVVGFTCTSPTGFVSNAGGNVDSAVFTPNESSTGNIDITFTWKQNYACNPYNCFPYACNSYQCNPYQCNPYVCITGTGFLGIPIFGLCYNTCFQTCFQTCYQTCYQTCTRFASATISTTIHDLSNVNFTNLATQYCQNAPVVSLEGNFSNTGFSASIPAAITGTNFNPGEPTIGSSIDLYYAYTDANSCLNIDTQTVTIDTIPILNFTGSTLLSGGNLLDSICPNSGVETLTGNFTTNSAFTLITGLSNTIPGVAEFNPSVPTATGSAQNIEYHFTDGNGCKGSITKSIDLNPLPTVFFSGVNTNFSYCEDATTTLTTGNNAPNGVFFGTGMGLVDNGNGTANINPLNYIKDSTYSVSYTFTDNKGCADTSTTNIYIRPKPTLNIIGLADYYCESGNPVTLTANLTAGVSMVFSGNGITNNGDGTGILDPMVPAAGILDTITYTYVETGILGENACQNSVIDTTLIKSLPVVNISGLNAEYCADYPADTIKGNYNGGIFSGPGIIDFDTTGIATFNPSFLDDELYYYIYYDYTDTFGCANFADSSVYINELPVVSVSGINSNYSYCEDAVSSLITGNDAPNGMFFGTGAGLFDNGDGTAYIDPFNYIKDSTYTISYTFIDFYGCTDTTTKSIYIRPKPTLNFTGLSGYYCESDDAIMLTGNLTSGASMIFYGDGIINNSDGTALYIPSFPVSGTLDTVTYYYAEVGTLGEDACDNYFSDTTRIRTLPTVVISSLDPDYCSQTPADTILGNHTEGIFSGSGVLDLGNGVATFNSSLLADNSVNNVVFKYTDVFGCTKSDTDVVVINPLPIVSYTGLTQSVLCNSDAPVVLTGSPLEGTNIGDSAIFRGDSLIEGIIDNGNGTALIRPDLAITDSVFDITYVYMDDNGCIDSLTKQLRYSRIPIITISGLDSIYCEDEEPDNLTATTDQLGSGNTWFNGNGASKIGPLTGLFDPSTAGVGVHIIDFEQINSDGCQSFVYDTTRVISIPDVGFQYSGFCNNDSISFLDNSTTNIYDSIIAWVWDYDNGLSLDSTISGKTFYQYPGKYNVALEVFTKEQCSNKIILTDTIGTPPNVDFFWDNICFEDTIHFRDTSSVDNIIDPIVSWSWQFGDGSSSLLQHPQYVYAAINNYNIKLKLTTNKGCQDSLTRAINVRPVVSSYPYVEDFESGNAGWFASGQIGDSVDASSWMVGIANGTVINDVANGNNSFNTGIDSTYAKNEISFVDGACFDFSSLQRPMIVFDKQSNTNKGIDGVNLQYSTDNGTVWNNLGTFDGTNATGLNWYNALAIAANPGEELKGWSGDDSIWVEARHALDEIPLSKRDKVKLRFTFASTASTTPKDGFAFDNIWIGERSRVVLVEHFTNSSDQNASVYDDNIDNMVANNPNDILDVQLHTDFNGLDKMNLDASADASARSLYYGVFSSGRDILDGNIFNGLSSQLTELDLKLRTLVDADFDIQIKVNYKSTGLSVEPEIKAVFDFEERDLAVHVVVLEKEITSLTGAFGDNNFKSVMKQMLPDAAGTKFVKTWTKDETATFYTEWELANIYDNSQLRVVVYVQDNITKEILQSAYLDEADFGNATSINEYNQNGLVFKLFPNPTNDVVFVQFNTTLKESVKMEVYNQIGELLTKNTINNGINKYSFDTENLPNGIYFVKLTDENNNIKTRKLSVIR